MRQVKNDIDRLFVRLETKPAGDDIEQHRRKVQELLAEVARHAEAAAGRALNALTEPGDSDWDRP